MPKRYLITSALPYINGVKHIGNLVGSQLPADVYARFLRSRGEEVLLICATDEHGTPAELAALEAGQGVETYCAEQHEIQGRVSEQFSLSWDYFGRSSSPQNRELTQHFAKLLEENGYIEERTIGQVYSIDDQRFLPDRYVTGTCPHCGYERARGDQCENCTRVLEPTQLLNPRSTISGSTNLEVRETKHLYLKLPELASDLKIKEWIDSHPDWPILTRSIAYKWFEEGLHDRAITRDLKWGVPVNKPGFEGKVFYVWFDAPIEYIGATQEWADQQPGRDWKSWWSDAKDVHYVQFMAKDNVPFHAVFFPGMCMGTKEPWKLADYIKAFNWLTYYGGKFSTSQKRGVFMDQALDLLPADFWRYWLMANAPESDDSSFTWELFAERCNKGLGGTFGNFVNRTLQFANRIETGKVPSGGTPTAVEEKLTSELAGLIVEYTRQLEMLEFRKAVATLDMIWTAGNVYLQNQEPWKVQADDPERCACILRTAINLIRVVSILSEPVIPETANKVLDALHVAADERRWIDANQMNHEMTTLAGGQPYEIPPVLFPRIEGEQLAAWKSQFAGAEAATTK